MASAIGSERALASAQKSPPGQAIMSVSNCTLALARPRALASCHRSNRRLACTQGSSTFWSCVTRASPAEYLSTRSARAISCSLVASPGDWPGRLNDSVTARSCGFWCGCTLRCSQRPNITCSAARASSDACSAAGGTSAMLASFGVTKQAATRSNSACGMVWGPPSISTIWRYSSFIVDVLLAFGLDQNLDAGLVLVVAAAVLVVHAHDGLDVIHDLVPGQELADHGANHRRATHATAHKHLEADLALLILEQVQAHVVPARGGAVVLGTADGDLELAWQKSELGVQRGPLADDFRIGARVHDLVHGNAGQGIGGGVADAVAAGLDAVHVHSGQQVHHIRTF